jgi:hypothetical protein
MLVVGNLDTSLLGLAVIGNLVCERIQAVAALAPTGNTSVSSSFYAYDESLLVGTQFVKEQYTVDALAKNASVSIGVLLNNVGGSTMECSLRSSADQTTVYSTASDRTSRAIVFTSDGISFASDADSGIYFGGNRDFKITMTEGTEDILQIQAYSSVINGYQTKYSVGSA